PMFVNPPFNCSLKIKVRPNSTNIKLKYQNLWLDKDSN
ncbi:MAG: hypothetical protein ACI8QD_001224, partial [Cyclobacteriaceae bacterium]